MILSCAHLLGKEALFIDILLNILYNEYAEEIMVKKTAEEIIKDFIESKISFGKGIKMLRSLKGCTQEQVARGMGVSLTYYCMLENSRVLNPSLQIAMRMLQFYGITFPFEKFGKGHFLAKEIPCFSRIIPLKYPKEIPEEEIEAWTIIGKNAPVDFVVLAYDDSMRCRGIRANDRVSCKIGIEPKNGDIVVARTDKKGHYIIRIFMQYKDEIVLMSSDEENEIVSAKNLDILGVVIGIVQTLNEKALQTA
jgi:SOS-response transcriptional repressor LexA